LSLSRLSNGAHGTNFLTKRFRLYFMGIRPLSQKLNQSLLMASVLLYEVFEKSAELSSTHPPFSLGQ